MSKLSPAQRRKRLEKLGKLVADKKLWQSALADVAGVNPSSLARIMTGDREMSTAFERRIAEGAIKESKKVLGRGAQMLMLAQEIVEELDREKKS